ncbi:MAG TPA: hypothetical protein VER11_06065 [Polyangiaceae bacterium]|nr:hypothetical protein [Polyangiaceae bacterium]
MARKAKRKARAGRRLNAKQVEERLLATSFPRLQMMLILSLAAVGTFLCSALLVRCGLKSMGVRYALAVLGGYLSFLSFVRVWIAYQTRNWAFGRAKQVPSETRSVGDELVDGLDALSKVDLPDLSALGELGSSAGNAFSGAGGGFGGGGASGSFDLDLGSGDSGASDALDAVSGSDDALPIAIAVIALLGGVVALGFVVYSSPVLFAEVLLDVAVLGAVYKKNQRHERGHWAAGVIGRTYKPMLVLAVFAGIFGFAMQSTAPQATTLGAVLQASNQEPPAKP